MECMEAAHTGLDLWYRPMFGEYCIYSGEKPLLLVCDNTAFVKVIECLAELLADAERREPFPGAKGYVVLDVEDTTLLHDVLLLLDSHKPMPKLRKRRKSKC